MQLTPQASSASRWPTRAASRSTVWAYQCRLCFGFCWLTARAHTQHACAIILPRSTLSLELPTGSATPPFRGVRASSRSHARGGDRSQCTSQTRQERRQESVRTGHLPWFYPRRTGSRCLRAAGPVLAIVFFYELWSWRRRRGASASPSVQHSLSALVPRRGLTFWGAAGIPFCGLCAWACGPQESWPNASAGLTVADRPMQWSQARRQACCLGILARRLLRRPHRL